jgi:hypothetical protein
MIHGADLATHQRDDMRKYVMMIVAVIMLNTTAHAMSDGQEAARVLAKDAWRIIRDGNGNVIEHIDTRANELASQYGTSPQSLLRASYKHMNLNTVIPLSQAIIDAWDSDIYCAIPPTGYEHEYLVPYPHSQQPRYIVCLATNFGEGPMTKIILDPNITSPSEVIATIAHEASRVADRCHTSGQHIVWTAYQDLSQDAATALMNILFSYTYGTGQPGGARQLDAEPTATTQNTDLETPALAPVAEEREHITEEQEYAAVDLATYILETTRDHDTQNQIQEFIEAIRQRANELADQTGTNPQQLLRRAYDKLPSCIALKLALIINNAWGTGVRCDLPPTRYEAPFMRPDECTEDEEEYD